MLFGQVDIELGSFFSVKNILALLLLLVAVSSFVWPWLTSKVGGVSLPVNINKPTATPSASGPKLKRRDVDRSSDTPPPNGFANHLKIIEATAPNADAKVWWEYAKAEMTEAEVAIAEAKLARRPDPDKAV
jgi:hypothetical protein